MLKWEIEEDPKIVYKGVIPKKFIILEKITGRHYKFTRGVIDEDRYYVTHVDDTPTITNFSVSKVNTKLENGSWEIVEVIEE